MANSGRASGRTKHKVSWRDVLSSHFRKAPTYSHRTARSPVSSNRTNTASSKAPTSPSRSLVRSNARAKSPKNLQTPKSARINVRNSKSNGEDSSGDIDRPIPPLTDGDMEASIDTKIPTLSPPPYVLSLPEAVVTPSSLVTITNDELRSRGIYSPHPGTEHGMFHASLGQARPFMNRNASFRSVLSMLAPRLGPRSISDTGNVLPRSEDHARNQPSLLSSSCLALGICVLVLITSLDRNSIVTAIPSILADFKSFQEMGWYGSAYLMSASAFQPLYGRIYTSFNVKWSFLVAVAVFELGAFICAIAPNSEAFILGRAVQGLGSAGISTGSFAIVTHSFGPNRRHVLLAVLDVLAWTGTVAGPVLGAVFSQLLSWRWCCYLNLLLAGTAFVCVLLFSESHQSRTPRPNLIRQASDFSSTGKTFARRVLALDWVGSTMFMAALTFLSLALQSSQQQKIDSTTSLWIVFISLSVITTILCLLWMQLRGDDALIPFHILRQRTVAASCGAAFFLHGAFTIHIYYLPIWFRIIRNESAIRSGIAVIPYMLTMALLGLAASHIVFKNGHFALFAVIGCGMATFGAGLITIMDSEVSIFACAGFQMLMAAGLGMAWQKSLSAVQAVLPPHELPIGTAAIAAYQNAGGAVFVSVGNALFQKHLFQSEDVSIVNIRIIMKLGMTQFATLTSDEAYPDVVRLYNHAVRAVFIVVIPLCGMAILFSMCIERSITHDDHNVWTPELMDIRGVNRGFSSPELGSDAPTLAHLAPRARHRWSQRRCGPITDVEIGRTRLNTDLQESNGSQSSLSSLEGTMDAEVKDMDIGVAH